MAQVAFRKKLVVVGDGTCGKTSLLLRFARDEFLEGIYVPTVFETYVSDMEIAGKKVGNRLHKASCGKIL